MFLGTFSEVLAEKPLNREDSTERRWVQDTVCYNLPETLNRCRECCMGAQRRKVICRLEVNKTIAGFNLSVIVS